MYHPVSIFVGLRYLRGRSGDRFSRFVSLMSTMGITIGVLSLVTVLSVMNGFEGQLKGRILGVLPQAIISESGGKTDVTTAIPPVISTLPYVQSVAPVVSTEAVVQSAQQLAAVQLVGIELENDPIKNFIMSSPATALSKGSYELFLGHTLARKLQVQPGDKVRVMVTSVSQYTPLGRIPSQRNFTVAGVFNTGSDVDAQLMVTNITDAGKLLRFKEGTATGWRLFLDDPFVVSELSQAELGENWQWQDWRSQRGELFQAVGMEKNMMGLMLSLIVAVAAFNIISALIMVVMEKQAEVAILKTQGMTQWQVMSIFIVQGASSGVVGAISGGLLGILLASNINSLLALAGVSLYAYGGSLPILIDYQQIMVVILGAIVLSIIATLFPSYRASSVKPAEALRYE
jgi:lipoprotein-releasing system permease protein